MDRLMMIADELTKEEKEQVIELAYKIAVCKSEPDKLLIYADILHQIFSEAYK